MAGQAGPSLYICPHCGPHDRVYKVEDLVEGWWIGLAGHPTVAPERVANLRTALAIPTEGPKITADEVLRYYNYVATAGRIFGLHLPHLSRGSYGWLAAICGMFAIVFFGMVGEKPVQVVVTSSVFAALAVFFFLRWREAGLHTEIQAADQARRAQECASRSGALRYCDQCQAIFPEASGDVMAPDAVRGYVATGAIATQLVSAPE